MTNCRPLNLERSTSPGVVVWRITLKSFLFRECVFVTARSDQCHVSNNVIRNPEFLRRRGVNFGSASKLVCILRDGNCVIYLDSSVQTGISLYFLR